MGAAKKSGRGRRLPETGDPFLWLEGITELECLRGRVCVCVWSNLGVLALEVVSSLESFQGFLTQLLFLQQKLQKHQQLL